ncbi:ATP-dependent sacrificial sulfur transferase LarE [Streptomyces mirabilis]|uniref:ATP-dependent sacrificial sulfur transferase LarE n=1 Tax=Streptomyces mirabilis TaxID=68239 RepID=UPI0021C0BA4B|nr:ATP-dependent sacrificial sulfur transferase LarE [Streptomyces mirabilis]MCT9108930.1 ATP-dependent sacrificial sulfur transferase LarE [Streptomyces mirabilis]
MTSDVIRQAHAVLDPTGDADVLLTAMSRLDSVVVAFSGGVDSTVVLAAALRALGPSRTLAATADSPALAREELRSARVTAEQLGAELTVLATDELAVPGYRANAGDRCYFCKHTVLSRVTAVAGALGYRHVVTGTHSDDRRSGHRPGLRAAEELSIVEPLADAGLGKAQVRGVAREWGLAVAEKPGSPCLASRIAVGVPVSRERLELVERAEDSARSFLAERHVPVRDLRVRILAQGFRIDLDADSHQWLGRRPDEAAALLGRIGLIADSSAGTIAPYRPGGVSTLAALSGITQERPST